MESELLDKISLRGFKHTVANYKSSVFLVLVFSIGYGLIGPLLHEFGHYVLLLVLMCGDFVFNYGFNVFTGFRGDYEVFCSIEGFSLFLFYSSGYLFTLVFGLLCFLVPKVRDMESFFISVLGVGCLVSILASLPIHGDLDNALRVYGLGEYSLLLKTGLGVLIGVFTVLEVESFV